MPRSPATPHSRRQSDKRSSESTPTKEIPSGSRKVSEKPQAVSRGADLGAHVGNSNTATVRQKILKWQVQGGGVVPVEDKTSSDDGAQDTATTPKSKESAPPIESVPETSKSAQGFSDSPKVEGRDSTKGRKITHNELSPDIKVASAPRKRVVSDGHWVRHKGSSRIVIVAGSGSKQASPKTKQSVEQIESKISKEQTTPPAIVAPAKRRPSKSTPDKEGIRKHHHSSRVGNHDRKKTKATEHRRRRISHGKESGSNSQGSTSSHSTPFRITTQDSTRKGNRQASEVRSHDDEPDTPSPQIVKKPSERQHEKPHIHKRKITTLKKQPSEVKDQCGDHSQKEDALVPAPVFSNRIESWLIGTSDPFVDDKESSSSPPTKHHPKRRHKSRKHRAEIDESKSSDEEYRSQRRYEVTEFATVEKSRTPNNASDENSSQPGLKRSGAKRNFQSPTRERRKHQPKDEKGPLDEDTITTAPLSVDPSAEEVWEDLPTNEPYPSRRQFPTTGKRLSTIASVETFNTRHHHVAPPSISEASENTAKPPAAQSLVPSEDGNVFDANSLSGTKGKDVNLKRRLTTHADLISVLSLPNAGSKSIISARSIQTNRSRLSTATMSDLLKELETDETKYMRELTTLADGVIPVLLKCVLSKSDSAVAAGLFSRTSPAHDFNVTKPIVDMGIALERLKSTHKRIPLGNPELLLFWAQGAQRVYADYLKAWRLGFQDVVVNLAPASEEDCNAKKTNCQSGNWEEGLPRNDEGYVVNGDGERVDVAFLLKRPLVRLKYLAKTFKGINIVKPSQQAEELATKYESLVIEARKRSNEEQARLEDEAAASIDPTRARDPKTLAPLVGVSIDSTRCVTARDYFDMNLKHSSGQLLDCKVEMLIRDDAPGRGNSGDVLICEISSTGRWLLFPPIDYNRISARNGDSQGEIVVMIRGMHSGGQEWQELMSLLSQDEETGFEWVQMLGLQPVPPDLHEKKLFQSKKGHSSTSPASLLGVNESPSTAPLKSRTPSPREIQIPIGERVKADSKILAGESKENEDGCSAKQSSPPSIISKDQTKPLSPRPSEEPYFYERIIPNDAKEPDYDSYSENRPESGDNSPSLRRAKAQRRSRHATLSSKVEECHQNRQSVSSGNVSTPVRESRPSLHSHSTSSTISSGKDYRVWFPVNESDSDDSPDEDKYSVSKKQSSSRPAIRDRASSVPSTDLPSIPRTRKSDQPTTPQTPRVGHDHLTGKMPVAAPKENPLSAPSKLQKRTPKSMPTAADQHKDVPPTPPTHRAQKPSGLKNTWASSFTPLIPGFRQQRRSSSPLKHEYEPSTATESSEDSDQSGFNDNVSLTSESSDGEDLGPSLATPVPPPHGLNKLNKRSPEGSLYSFPNANVTIAPSQSASQAPYRTVPPQAAQASKTIASIFSWSDMGQWEPLHPDECSIVITPGLIEAFELTAAHSKSNKPKDDDPEASNTEPPLIGLELTPLVPIRRGTALDISIRSPPTANSKVRSGNNILFRSRSAEECEALYGLINRSRINNPTYIALQHARGPTADSSWAAVMDRRNSQRASAHPSGGGGGGGSSSSSWWRDRLGSRASSYRAKSSRAASVTTGAGASESSVASMTSAFSALKRFSSGGGRLFNVARSTVTSRAGTAFSHPSSASWSSSSGSSTPLAVAGTRPGAPAPAAAGLGVPPAQLGITSVKVRLYLRETASKWRDMGSARLTIMQPARASPGGTAQAGGGGGSPGMRGASGGAEKRIVVNGKTKGEVLLDVTLGESCFERVARTGIAVSVWEETRGPNGEWGHVAAKGGVGPARAKVYMIQMKSERDCAYTFSLVGKLRY